MINETDYTNNPLTKEQESQIDEIFAQLDTADKPGCSVGVIQDGRFIYKKSFGMSDLDHDIPITSKSKFKIGSVTKEFTVSCIVLLALEGKLDLDDEVKKYITEMPDYGSSITIRQLIYHTSGLRDYANLLLFSGFNFENSYDNKFVKKIIFRQRELDFEPGDMHSYSNSGYILLAEIIKIITGKSLRDYAFERIFKPLGMINTFFVSDRKEVVKNRVIPYNVQKADVSYFLHNIEALGAGNIYSTIEDFIKWDNNFENPVVGGKEFVKLIEQKGHLKNNEIIEEYGMGFMHGTHSGRHWLGHGGAYYGFRSFHMRFPDHNTSIILMANREDVNEWGKCLQISDILLKSTDSISSSDRNDAHDHFGIKLNKSDLKKFCGHFWGEKERLNRKIHLKDGILYYSRGEDNDTKLLPLSSSELIMVDSGINAKLLYNFNTDPKTIKFIENGKVTAEFISYEPVSHDKEYFRNFTGRFYNDELEVFYDIKIESEKLILYINDIRISDINEFVFDYFEIPEWSSFIKFKFNKQKKIIGFIFYSTRIKRIEFEKVNDLY